MNLPIAYLVKIEREYETHEYIEFCKEYNYIPTKKGFFNFIVDDLAEEFPMSSFSEGDLDPLFD